MYLADRVISLDQLVFKAIIDYTKSRDCSLNIHNYMYQSFLSSNSITPQHHKGSSVLDLLQTLECATWWEIEGEESILMTGETEISMISIQVNKWNKVIQTTV